MVASTITIGTAVPAAAVVDSIGVATHWEYGGANPYTAQYAGLKARLLELGIRHVRGDSSRAADLWAAGIRTTTSGYSGGATPADVVASLRSLAAVGAIDAVEGPNEPDNFWLSRTYRGSTGPAAAILWQQDLWAAVRADDAFGTVTVVGPALGKAYFGGGSPFPADSLRDFVDVGNFHPYPQINGFNPGTITYAGITQYYYKQTMPSGCLDVFPRFFDRHRPPFGNKPMWATETGYPTWSGGQSAITQGKYMPRIMLENFRLGIKRTFLYELVDQGTSDNREQSFGLLYNDLSPKPSWRALQAVIGAFSDPLADPTAPNTPVSMALTVDPPSGYTAAQVHTVTAVKASGRWVVAVWHEVTAEDASQPIGSRDLSNLQPIPATLDLGRAVQNVTVRTLDPTTGTAAAPDGVNVSGQTVSFSVTDTVTLITADPVPPGGGGPGDPTPRWDPVPVWGEWHTDPITETPSTGSVEFEFLERINSTDGGTIYPHGYRRLVTLDGQGRIAVAFPGNDDPAIVQKGWSVKVTERIDGKTAETYYIQPSLLHLLLTPAGLNLGTVLKENAQSPSPALVRGVPGGVAALDADGDVIDADGVKVSTAPAAILGALGAALVANPREAWQAGKAYPAWSQVTWSQGFYTATRDVPARSVFGDLADGWLLTGFDAGTM